MHLRSGSKELISNDMSFKTKDKISATIYIVYIMLITSILLMVLTFMYFKFSTTNGITFDNSDTYITLNDPWKFKTGDNQQWAIPNFNDSEWEIVDFAAPPGARDGDVGISGYVPGWTGKGHPNYAGYAWYRIKVPIENLDEKNLFLLAPSAVDDAYQIYINGELLASAGDFSDTPPTAYSIQPRMFLLPENAQKEDNITIAFRVWMSAATLGQVPDLGGIHVAPMIGEKSKIGSIYKLQWQQTIKGYIVEVVLPVIFILLAITMFLLHGKKRLTHSCKWFIIALVLLAMVRLNQAVYYWFQIESAHQFDIVTTVILMPLILGSWLMAWWKWYDLKKPKWIPKIILILTLSYLVSQLLGLSWISESINHTLFLTIVDYTRLLFILLMLFIIYRAILKHGLRDWITLLATLLVSIGIFSKEVSALHIPGIWFPYGVGVSRTQYVYAAFVVLMYIILLQKSRKTLS